MTRLIIIITLPIFLFLGCNNQSQAPSNYNNQSSTPTSPNINMSDSELKETLSPLAYKVTKEDGTEPPFQNEYWNNKEAGIYVDVISGIPLFASIHKYDSGTGWPSFWKTVNNSEIVEVVDRSLGIVRTEVRTKTSDSHLGHLFKDGPKPTGLRYCMNSAAMKFIPLESLEKEGLGDLKVLFEGGENQ